MSCEAEFTEVLRQQGYRITPQRRIILHILRQAGDHLTPGEVFERAQESLPGLTETTVYRTLEFLAQVDLAQAAFGASGKRTYEISDHAHHHLLCSQCGQELEIPHARLAELFAELEGETQFQLSQNHITLFGLCPNCQS
jgi:Fur family ferric uptake transcriptional regulator